MSKENWVSIEMEIPEEEITGKAATLLHSFLFDPPKNPPREQMIKAAIKRFPHPGKAASLDIDLQLEIAR